MPVIRLALKSIPFWVLLLPLMAVEEANSVADYQWTNRVLLLRIEDVKDASIDQLKHAHAAIDERDLLWFALHEETGVTSNDPHPVNDALTASIKKIFARHPHDRIILIGKDGGVKERTDALNLDELFALIDAMPMRRAEMRTQSGS